MAKYKDIKVDIFKRYVTVFIGSKQELYNYVVNYNYGVDLVKSVKDVIEEDSPGMTFYNSSGISLIYIENEPTTPESISILGHEVLHAVFHLFGYVGVDFIDNSSNETFTYAFDYILKRALTKKGYKDVKKNNG